MVKTVEEIEHPAIREVLRKYGNKMPLEISHIGDLPAKSGIGSSSSFTVGLINSINTMQGKYIGKHDLALAAIKLEQNEMKEDVGIQDQCAAAYGGLCLIKAYQDEITAKKFICSTEYKKYIQENLLLGFNGLERYSGVSSKKTINCLKDKSYISELPELMNYPCKLTKICRDIKKRMNGDK